jgi:hypothetical protein
MKPKGHLSVGQNISTSLNYATTIKYFIRDKYGVYFLARTNDLVEDIFPAKSQPLDLKGFGYATAKPNHCPCY